MTPQEVHAWVLNIGDGFADQADKLLQLEVSGKELYEITFEKVERALGNSKLFLEDFRRFDILTFHNWSDIFRAPETSRRNFRFLEHTIFDGEKQTGSWRISLSWDAKMARIWAEISALQEELEEESQSESEDFEIQYVWRLELPSLTRTTKMFLSSIYSNEKTTRTSAQIWVFLKREWTVNSIATLESHRKQKSILTSRCNRTSGLLYIESKIFGKLPIFYAPDKVSDGISLPEPISRNPYFLSWAFLRHQI